MTLEKNNRYSSQINTARKAWCAKSAALSLSLMLGACASTSNKPESVDDASKAEPVQMAQAQEANAEKEKAQAASTVNATELMKTLEAPLVEPETVDENEAVDDVDAAGAKVSAVAEPMKKVSKKVVKVVSETAKKVPSAPPVKAAPPAKKAQSKVAKTSGKLSAKAFKVSTKKLPFTYDIWTIKNGNTLLTQGLVIETPTWEVGKEGYTSQIWLTLMEDKIHVNSSSDIETASKGLGIRIDGGDLIPFSSIAEKNIGVISGEWLNKLSAANKVDIYLGFFPGKKPTSDTFSSNLSLKNLARMVATYRTLK